jgi:error-prone DNA polymerase
VISSGPLCDVVPIMPTAMPGRQIIQWDKDSCSDAGLLKIDVLGLGMLSAVEECVATISDVRGETIDLSRIDYDDRVVFQEIKTADTVGVFQIESRAQMQSLPRVQPDNLHDLAIQVALVRPGPIIGGSVNPFIEYRERKRKNPDEVVPYDHPLLEPVLKETHGAVIWQDQVLGVVMALSGFSAGEADGLRRAMTRKRSEEAIASHYERFVAGAVERGVSPEIADKVFDKLRGFSSYGFPKAHSVAFALLAYQSSWLRHYYPAEFFAALINAQPMGFYSRDTLLRDARRCGVGARGPDVNASCVLSTVEPADDGYAIRLGLSVIDHIGMDDARVVEEERRSGGPFTSIENFAQRVPLRIDLLEQLVMAGATASLPGERREQLWQLGMVARPVVESNEAGALQATMDTVPDEVPELPQLSLFEQVALDFEKTGISVRAHPVELLRPVLGENVVSVEQLKQCKHGATVEVVGRVIARQRPETANGVLFILLEDETGMANVVVLPPVYKKVRMVARSSPMLRVHGRVELRKGILNVLATDLVRLPANLVDGLEHPPILRNFN